MDKFIVVNVNPVRDAQYESEDYDAHTPYWLSGQYVKRSDGDCTDDIYGASLYIERKTADAAAKRLTKKFKHDGTYFTGGAYQTGYLYPESCGKKGYAKFAPEYEVRRVEVSIKVAD
jgi:hypothetical protein